MQKQRSTSITATNKMAKLRSRDCLISFDPFKQFSQKSKPKLKTRENSQTSENSCSTTKNQRNVRKHLLFQDTLEQMDKQIAS